MTDEAITETEPTDDLAPCETCGANNGALIKLDDGTVYCSAHRGLAHDSHSAPQPAVSAPTQEEAEADFIAERDAFHVGGDVATDGADDEPPWPMLAPVRMVASLCFEAALATFHSDGTFGDPPTGWAPPPANDSPFMEAGVVLAVATLIEAAEIDRNVIQTLADVFAGRETPTESDDHE